MKTITRQKLVEMIDAEKGTEMVSIHITTEPSMNKTGNPFLGALKHVALSGVIGYDYNSSVNNQLVREGKEATFEAQPRTWGVRLDNRWVMHKEERYLTMKVQSSGEVLYTLNGDEVSKDAILPFLRKSKEPSTQEGLEKKVIHRDIKVSNIDTITMKGETYKVIG